MEIQPKQAIPLSSAVRFFRWGLRGGGLSALGALCFFLLSHGTIEATVAIIGIGAVIGGGVPTIASLLTRRRRDTLDHIERELERARMMMERRLIDENDYQRLKSQALETYRIGGSPARPLWPLASWGAVAGAVLCSLLAVGPLGQYLFTQIFITTAGVALVGGSITGAAAQAYVALAGQGPRTQLPAPQQGRRMLGE